MKKDHTKIAVLTSGGDAPGMNAAIRAVVRTALSLGATPYGVQRGYAGLLDGEVTEMTAASVGGIINRGGTILRTARTDEFKKKAARQKAAENLLAQGIDCLAVIGGDGSFRGARAFAQDTGIKVIGIPGTIDNDISGTDFSIGYFTAVDTAVEAIDKLRDTADSHDRVFVVEVMGHASGFIAVSVGLCGGAEAIIIPEVKTDLAEVSAKIKAGYERGKKSCIIVVAEGAMHGLFVADQLAERTGFETRAVVLGHLQRGGPPNSLDRILASRLGSYATHLLLSGETCKMVGVVADRVVSVDIADAWRKRKSIDRELLALTQTLSI
jgi:6-phosphofructokinase 1